MACGWDTVRRIYSSSGTTGRPAYIGLSKHDISNVWLEIASRAHYCNGFRSGDRVVLTINIGPFAAGSELNAFENIGSTTIPLPPGNTERVLTAIRLGANAILGTPSYIQYLITWCSQKGIDHGSLGVKKIAVSGEPGGGIPAIRDKIESAFNAVVTESAGLADMAMSIWGDCEHQAGMHFCAQEFIIAEIIDPDTGRNIDLKDGTRGELVYTAIDRECTPLLRFRSRDHIEVWTSKCGCGRTSPRIRIIGRTDDMLIIQGVNVFPSAIKAVVGDLKPRTTGEMEIQLIEPGPAAKAPLSIKVEYGSEAGNLEHLKTEIETALREKLVFRAQVQLVPEGALPRYEYKGKLIRKLYEEKQH
jgi:phenylacetate-CoA ligase